MTLKTDQNLISKSVNDFSQEVDDMLIEDGFQEKDQYLLGQTEEEKKGLEPPRKKIGVKLKSIDRLKVFHKGSPLKIDEIELSNTKRKGKKR